MYRFCFDIDPDRTWHAPAIGEPWNGFLTPHVTADVAAQIFAYMLIECPDHYTVLRIDPDGTMTLAEADGRDTYLTICTPGPDGLIDLGTFGWTFVPAGAA